MERSLLPLPLVESDASVVSAAFDAVLSVVLVLLVDDDEFEDELV